MSYGTSYKTRSVKVPMAKGKYPHFHLPTLRKDQRNQWKSEKALRSHAARMLTWAERDRRKGRIDMAEAREKMAADFEASADMMAKQAEQIGDLINLSKPAQRALLEYFVEHKSWPADMPERLRYFARMAALFP